MIQQALRIAPQNADLLASLGWAYYNAGDFENAATYLENALALVPDNPTFISQLKAVYEASGNGGKLEKLRKREEILEN